MRAKVNAGEIGSGGDRFASHRGRPQRRHRAGVGLGWCTGARLVDRCAGYLPPRRGELQVVAADTAGPVAAVCALALVVAALWLQHSCKSPPQDPSESTDTAPE